MVILYSFFDTGIAYRNFCDKEYGNVSMKKGKINLKAPGKYLDVWLRDLGNFFTPPPPAPNI
jgi:hypothetical protein